jgi:hypothetical protein
MWSGIYGVKKTSQRWSEKRNELKYCMYPKIQCGSDKTKLDHLYPSICYECLNGFVTLDGSPSFLFFFSDPGISGDGVYQEAHSKCLLDSL